MKIEIYDKLGNNIGVARSIRVERESRRREFVYADGRTVDVAWGPPTSINIEMGEVAILLRDDLMAMMIDVKLSQPNTVDAWFKDCMVTEVSRTTNDWEILDGRICISKIKLAVRNTEGVRMPDDFFDPHRPAYSGRHGNNKALKEWEEIWG
jgi:hypothetical protein